MFFSFCPLFCCRAAAALLLRCIWRQRVPSRVAEQLIRIYVAAFVRGAFKFYVPCALHHLWGGRGAPLCGLWSVCWELHTPFAPPPTHIWYDPCIELIEFCIMSDNNKNKQNNRQQLGAGILCTYFRILHFLFAICASLEMHKILEAWQV